MVNVFLAATFQIDLKDFFQQFLTFTVPLIPAGMLRLSRPGIHTGEALAEGAAVWTRATTATRGNGRTTRKTAQPLGGCRTQRSQDQASSQWSKQNTYRTRYDKAWVKIDMAGGSICGQCFYRCFLVGVFGNMLGQHNFVFYFGAFTPQNPWALTSAHTRSCVTLCDNYLSNVAFTL